ncbi:MAG: endonuclease MutS2 [Candidatus Rokubacteria bacterium]|nr:endonuclease MutS2 [Candidatus Rokubacteria bacterium]
MLAAEARTAMGREQALATEPFTDVGRIETEIALTGEARAALAAAGPPPLDTIPDVRATLERTRLSGSVLDGPDLIQLLPLLEAPARLSAWARTARPAAPRVADTAAALPRLEELAGELRRALDDDGSVRDEASPRLRELRRDLRDRRRRIVGELERMFQGADADRILAERFVTIRHGRYVLPVRAEARGRVHGIVHDRSQSGQTIFVEPASVVDANNDLVQLAREEEQETTRILAALTDGVRAALPALDDLVARIGALDWGFARAHVAERMDATPPVIDRGRRVDVRAARHPLLLAQSWADSARSVVPLDLALDGDRPLLVITGPNAGGKTIALKTLALLALMAQVGCHVPAAEGSRLPVFERLYAVIGDDQSVAENLSTFSAFVRQVRDILDTADDHSLVLLDELGAGTDPGEGAALAQAILEALDARGAMVMASTHLEPLKAFASTHPRARNASVEFDTATLAPTFRLRYDRPGQSYALTIAARLGLAPDLIARAEAHRSQHAARLAELLERLDEFTRGEAERTIAVERRESEAAARLTAAREAEARAEARARDVVDRAKAEASTLLADIRRAIAAEWDRLKRSDRSRKSLDESRHRINDAVARVAPKLDETAPADPKSFTPGMAVAAEHLGLRGTIRSVEGDMATLQAGSVTVRVPVRALRPITEGGHNPRPAPGWRAASRGSGVSTEEAARRPGAGRTLAAELLLLGRTTDEARDIVEKYLDDAFMAGMPTVRLVHGKGTGALRKTVRELLAAHPLVDSYRDGEPSEGGAGATVAALKVS